MIVSKKCVAQTIPTDTVVLKYLYKEAASAYYMRKDIKLADSTISMQKHILLAKDSLLSNRNKALEVSELEINILNSQIENCESNNKKQNNQKKFYQFTTLLAILTTIISLFK